MLKTLKPIFFFLLMTPFLLSFSCDEDDSDDEEEVQRTSHTVSLRNESGAPGCGGFESGFQITYVVSYRDIQVDATINDGTFGVINVLVEDGESINVQVYRTDDDTLFADANVNVRTSSRPDVLEDEFRAITFCEAFNLIFENF